MGILPNKYLILDVDQKYPMAQIRKMDMVINLHIYRSSKKLKNLIKLLFSSTQQVLPSKFFISYTPDFLICVRAISISSTCNAATFSSVYVSNQITGLPTSLF